MTNYTIRRSQGDGEAWTAVVGESEFIFHVDMELDRLVRSIHTHHKGTDYRVRIIVDPEAESRAAELRSKREAAALEARAAWLRRELKEIKRKLQAAAP